MTMTSILEVLPVQFRAALRGLDWDKIQELRLRSGYPLGIKRVGEREAAHNAAHDPAHDAAGVVRAEDVAAVLAAATRQSAYSAQETLREGYLTLEGGHRVGVCGTLVLRGGEPYSMKDVTSLNIRVAHDIRMDSALFAGKSADHRCAGQRENNAAAGLHPDAQSDGTMCQRGG